MQTIQKTLVSRDVGSVLHEFGTFGKRPKVKFMASKLKCEWFYPNGEILQDCLNVDLAWKLVRLLPQILFCVDVGDHIANEQCVPDWSGFLAMVFHAVPS